MKYIVDHPLIVGAGFLWIGFICAISFMEAWLKFRAPGVTLPIGLGIGRLVFGMLNKVEWIFVLSIVTGYFISRTYPVSSDLITIIIPVVLLFIQTIWLLPALDLRAQRHIDGLSVERSFLHFYYVAMELLKVITIAMFTLRKFVPVSMNEVSS